ncbi:MAG: flagellar basal body-associated FliL family protein [Alphaproteobacteria bacterium]|tara:strand:- start:157 stop:774 length:618 start_codon:yes stop_codon:yes gene_type:complete
MADKTEEIEDDDELEDGEEYEDDDELEDGEEWEDDDEEWEDDEDDEPTEEELAAAKKKKTLKIAAIAGVLLVLIGGGFTAHMLGATEAILGKPAITEVTLEIGKPVIHQLPEIRTDLKKIGRRNHFIKLNLIVQVDEHDLPALQDEAKMALVVDNIKTQLRDLEYKDVIGKEGSERLRFELLNVINFAIAPVKAHTVLFKDLIIQ